MKRRSLYISTFFDILALFVAFFIMIWIKPATVRVYLPNYIIPFSVFASVWVFVSLVSQKYTVSERTSLSKSWLYILIINLIITGLAGILMFVLRSAFYSRMVFGGIIALTTFIELIFSFCDYYICNAKVGPDSSKVFEAYQRVAGRVKDIPEHELFPPELTFEPVAENIKDIIIEESNMEVFQFLAENMDLK